MKPRKINIYLSNIISIIEVSFLLTKNFILIFMTFYGPGSVVGIATGYGLDGAGIESRWGRDFPHLYRPALGPTQPPA
jgi:hypothetical protein